MNEELLPCPCCGAPAEYYKDFHGEGFMRAVACTRCDVAAVSVSQAKKEELIAAWNRRPA